MQRVDMISGATGGGECCEEVVRGPESWKGKTTEDGTLCNDVCNSESEHVAALPSTISGDWNR